MDQHFKNHSRYVPLYHFITPAILLLLTGACAYHLFEAFNDGNEWHHPALLLLGSIALWLIWFYARGFALRAQDRQIMFEEKMRYHQLTGKSLNAALTPSQIIALRFASDAEFPALAEKAVAENLSSKAIKESIQNWRADNYRV